uniref:Uncharacterized protein n=1 Tax=Rhinella marina erythrocytic-like virus TaxID=2859906 RepID=A0A8F6UA91_9VIRU|nr:hypothetical protein RMELV023 [Rhinella marina erythrocytic-like virus]
MPTFIRKVTLVFVRIIVLKMEITRVLAQPWLRFPCNRVVTINLNTKPIKCTDIKNSNTFNMPTQFKIKPGKYTLGLAYPLIWTNKGLYVILAKVNNKLYGTNANYTDIKIESVIPRSNAKIEVYTIAELTIIIDKPTSLTFTPDKLLSVIHNKLYFSAWTIGCVPIVMECFPPEPEAKQTILD